MGRSVILASTSPWRLDLLRKAGVVCEGRAPGVDEARVTADDPVALACARAVAKARAVEVAGAIVIGADQVAHIDGVPFGKPRDPDDHRARLRALRGRAHVLSSAVCVRGPDGSEPRETTLVEHARVHVRADLSDAEIDAYVAHGEGAGCAGGYAIEGLGGQLMDRVEGDLFTVIGLPVLQVLPVLRRYGWVSTLRGAGA
jgi:septum formation protein